MLMCRVKFEQRCLIMSIENHNNSSSRKRGIRASRSKLDRAMLAAGIKTQTALAQKIADGKQVYMKTCFACHQAEGQGIPNAFPPLAKSDYLNADVDRAIKIVKHGLTGEITVNGKKYNSVMTAQNITNVEIADVMTYIYNSWGNNKTNVTVNRVNKIK